MIEIEPLLGLRMINDGSVALLSTRRREKTNVSTLSWQMPLGQDPPMLGISLKPSSLSHELLRESGEFVLSIPDASLVAETHYCGTHSGRNEDKIRSMQFNTVRAKKVSPLLITNCIGHLECEVREILKFADCFFYAGIVVSASVEEDYFTDGWTEKAQTLHHLGGDRYKTGGGVLEAGKHPLPQQLPPMPPLFPG